MKRLLMFLALVAIFSLPVTAADESTAISEEWVAKLVEKVM